MRIVTPLGYMTMFQLVYFELLFTIAVTRENYYF